MTFVLGLCIVDANVANLGACPHILALDRDQGPHIGVGWQFNLLDHFTRGGTVDAKWASLRACPHLVGMHNQHRASGSEARVSQGLNAALYLLANHRDAAHTAFNGVVQVGALGGVCCMSPL